MAPESEYDGLDVLGLEDVAPGVEPDEVRGPGDWPYDPDELYDPGVWR